MAAVKDLISIESDGSISFGNYTLEEKAKIEDFKYNGDLLKVKTFKTMTKLENNGMFVYESVPGTSVSHFVEREDGVSFLVEGAEDAQLTIGLEDDTDYHIAIDGKDAGTVKTGLGGKLNVSVELSGAEGVNVAVLRA